MPTPPSRLAWLDLFRGACVVGMIETHVLNTFLVTSSRETTWFAWLTYFDGLIAPAFLFIAGYVQGLGMRRAGAWRDTLRRVPDQWGGGGAERNLPPPPTEVWDTTERVPPSDGSSTTRGWGRKLRRLGAVWLLGYALHFPAPQLFAGQWSEALRLGTQVDVLQCLAVSLALLLAIERWVPRWADFAALALLIVAVFAAEKAALWQFTPGFLRAYFNQSTGSLFPLLPWTGFVCAGWLASTLRPQPGGAPTVMESAGRTARSFPFLPAGLAVALVLILAFALPDAVAFFFHLLAWLLLAVPLVQWIATRWQPQWLLFAGRESLVLYAAHLVLIEVLAVTGLPRSGFSVAGCGLIFVVVLAITAAFALAWAQRGQRL